MVRILKKIMDEDILFEESKASITAPIISCIRSAMESKIVVLSYNPENLSESLQSSLNLMNGTSEIDFSVNNSSLEVTHFPSSKIVKLQYSNGRGGSFDGSDGLFLLSPSKSFQLHPSRSATPPTLTGSQEVATISNLQDFNEDTHKKYKKKSRNNNDPYTSIYRPFEDLGRKVREGRSTKSKDRLKSQSQLKTAKLLSSSNRNSLNAKDHKSSKNIPAPLRTHKQAIDGMVNYRKMFKMSDISLQEIEDDWLLNVRTVAERLHFLKEAYKAVQLTKKNMAQGKSDSSIQLHLNSSVVDSSLYLEEDHPSSSQSQPQLLQNNDEDSGSNSNSNTDTFPTASNPILRSIRR